MYSVIESEVVIEGEKHKTYGLKNEQDFVLKDISTDFNEVYELSKLLTKEEVEEKYVVDYVEEFLSGGFDL